MRERERLGSRLSDVRFHQPHYSFIHSFPSPFPFNSFRFFLSSTPSSILPHYHPLPESVLPFSVPPYPLISSPFYTPPIHAPTFSLYSLTFRMIFPPLFSSTFLPSSHFLAWTSLFFATPLPSYFLPNMLAPFQPSLSCTTC